MSKYGEEMVALNLGKRYGIPTVALRYSIVQGPRQSVYNAYSGACRIFNLHYLLGGAPTLYEDGQAIRDYVNIHDVVDANVLVLTDDRAVGRVFNVGGGAAYTTAEFAEVVRRHYGSDRAARGHRRVPIWRHAPHLLRHRRPQAVGLGPDAHPGRVGGRVRGMAEGHARASTPCSPKPTRRCARWAWCAGPAYEGVPARGGPGDPAAPAHRRHPEVPGGDRRPAAARHLAGRARESRRRRGARQHHHFARRSRHVARRLGRPRCSSSSSRRCSAARARCWPTGTSSRASRCSSRSRRQSHRLRPRRADRRPPRGRRIATLTVFARPPRHAASSTSPPTAACRLRRRSRRIRAATSPTPGCTPSIPGARLRSPERQPSDIGYHLLPRLVGRAHAVTLEGSYFVDIGTPAALERARHEWRRGQSP